MFAVMRLKHLKGCLAFFLDFKKLIILRHSRGTAPAEVQQDWIQKSP